MKKWIVFLVFSALIGTGCEKEEEVLFIENIKVEVTNNEWQNVKNINYIWSLKIVEEEQQKTNEPPYDRDYLVPDDLADDFKVSGLEVLVSGELYLDVLKSVSQSEPFIKLAPGYAFKITSIEKLNGKE